MRISNYLLVHFFPHHSAPQRYFSLDAYPVTQDEALEQYWEDEREDPASQAPMPEFGAVFLGLPDYRLPASLSGQFWGDGQDLIDELQV